MGSKHMKSSKEGLCETCQHRAESINRVKEWQMRGSSGIACDPAPKDECKDHEGYGRSGTKTDCSDYKHMNTEKPRLFIVNSFDRPEARLIAEMRADGKLYYIHPELKDKKSFHGMPPDHATPLEDFGIEVEVIGNCLEGSKTAESKAKYSDGKPREWQGQTKFSILI